MNKLPPNHISVQRTCLGAVSHKIVVTHLGKGIYGCRCFTNDILTQEIRVTKNLIGAACREMLRWEDKCGNLSDYADSSRHR